MLQLPREAADSGVGSYLDLTVENTTTVYLSLGNTLASRYYEDSRLMLRPTRKVNPNHARFQSAKDTLLVEVHGQQLYRYERKGHGIIWIATDMDPSRVHRIRVTFPAGPEESSFTNVDFEGVWVSKGGRLGSQQPQQRIYIEVVTATKLSDPATLGQSYAALLASAFNLTHSLVPATNCSLLDRTVLDQCVVRELYFERGSPGSRRSHIPHRYGHTAPKVLILELGLHNIEELFTREASESDFEAQLQALVHAYVTLVTTIRSAAQEYQPDFTALDASYTYNSAPSVLPIFLLTPFTRSERYRRLLGFVASTVVSNLRKEGDTSTVWIDTDGWLSPDDFTSDRSGSSELTESGHLKAATFLSWHVCPFLQSMSDCPYRKPTQYTGHLYLPNEADMGKLLEERKLFLIREALGFDAM